MTDSAKFWDRMAARYSKSAIADEAAYLRKLELARSVLDRDSEMLELACGTGSTAIALADCVKHIRATDISANMLAIAKGKAVEAGINNITFEQGAISELSIADSSLEGVMAHSILHLVEDRHLVIDQAFAALRPGGVFITSTICMGRSKLRFVQPVFKLASFFNLLPAIAIFTVDELRTDMHRAGFETVHDWLPGPNSALFLIVRKPK